MTSSIKNRTLAIGMSVEELSKENINIFLIDRSEAALTSIEKAILKRFYSRKESILEISVKFKMPPLTIVSILRESVIRLQLIQKRLDEKGPFHKSQLPTPRSCQICGRKLKDHESDVYCRSCLRNETTPYLKPKRSTKVDLDL